MKNLIYVITLLLFSCTQKEASTKAKIYDDFPEISSLNSTSIDEIKEQINPRYITIHQDKLIFCDPSSELQFYVYALPNFEFLGKFGPRGDGPLSIEDPAFWGKIENKNGTDIISIFQVNRNKFISFDMNKALKDSLKPEDIINVMLPSEIEEMVEVLKIGEHLYIGTGYSEKSSFFIYDSSIEDFKLTPYEMDFDQAYVEELRKNELYGMYMIGYIRAKPDHSLVVKARLFLPKIEVFNTKGELQFSISKSNLKKPGIKTNFRFTDDTNMYYQNLYLTDNYIYALNLNGTYKEIINGESSKVEIDVFDWKGNPVRQFKLNEGIAGGAPFVVDEKRKKIYIVNPKSEEDYFSQFSYE